jgi:hypothetical protein
MPSPYDYASEDGYERARDDWIAFPSLLTKIRSTDLDHVEQAVYDLKTVVVNVKDFGAKGDNSTDDTTAIQDAIVTAHAAGGGTVVFPTGIYLASVLEYDSNLVFKGVNSAASQIRQKNGTTDVLFKSNDNASTKQFVFWEDLFLSGFANQASSTGMLRLEGTTYSRVSRCQFSYAKNFAVNLLGGATQGDTMYNRIEGCVFQQILSGGAAVQLTPSTQVAGGSHPDGTVITGNVINGGSGVTGIKFDDPAIDSPGALGADGCEITHNALIEVPKPFDIAGQGIRIGFNRCEVTSGTMTVTIRTGTTNFPTSDVVFVGNSWPTHGSPSSFIFNDLGRRTVRWMDLDAAGTKFFASLTSGDTWLGTRTTGDAADRFAARSDGNLRWGDGTSSTDTTMFRLSAGILRTSGEYNSLVGATTNNAFGINVAGESSRRLAAIGDGTLKWGSGGVGGADVQFGRLAADIVGTGSGDKLVATAGLGVGNSASATTPGSVVKKMEVFDAAGSSLGFVPIYNSIT